MPAVIENRVLFKVGARADYLALEEKLSNALYFLVDTGELYKGSTLIASKQRVFHYTGTVPANAEAEDIFVLAAGQNTQKVQGDIVIWTLDDEFQQVAIFDGTEWVPFANKISASDVVLDNGMSLEDALANAGITAVPHVDNETLEQKTENGDTIFSIKDYKVAYYQYDSVNDLYVRTEVDATHPWRDGLVPQIISYDNELIFAWVLGATDNSLAERVTNLEDLLHGGVQQVPVGLIERVHNLESVVGSIWNYKGELDTADDLRNVVDPQKGDVYTVGPIGWCYDGQEWIPMGDLLAGYAQLSDLQQLERKVGTIEDLLGHPEIEEVDGSLSPATGLFADVITEIDVDGHILVSDGNGGVTFPVFDGEQAGVVPVPSEIDANSRATTVLNANGDWIEMASFTRDQRIGDLTLNNHQYNTVEEYVQGAIEATTVHWESINEE